MKKKLLIQLLCLVMMLFMLPITAFADPGDGNIDGGAASVSA